MNPNILKSVYNSYIAIFISDYIISCYKDYIIQKVEK